MRKNKAAAFMASLMVTLCVPQTFLGVPNVIVAEAHGGRTDSNGGHRDNKNASGLGSYHYHCGGHPAHLHTDGVCPYSQGGSDASQISNPEPEKPAVPENIDLVFDAAYYADCNQDLRSIYGYDEEQLLNHFLTSGMKEGRVACESFNVSAYRENNPDLSDLYGDNMASYYEHYMSCGHTEGRACH